MGKHDKTLAAIFARPTRGTIRWKSMESLLVHLGAEISEGEGSRVRVALGGVRAVFHRPHPKPTASKGAVEAVREFLKRAGFGVEETTDAEATTEEEHSPKGQGGSDP